MKNSYFLILCISISAFAQKGYPVPEKSATHLFYIQHSQNHNTFVYEANFEHKKINSIEPIKIHRIVYTKGGAKEELTKMQRNLAYGIDIKKQKENHYEFCLVSYPDKKMYLEIHKNGKSQVKTMVNGKKIILHKMYLSMQKGSLKPKIEFIDFSGTDESSGKEVKERFYLETD